jgi:hypothetical protein
MSKRRDPVNVIQDFFEQATAEQAATMQAVITGILHRRFDLRSTRELKRNRKPVVARAATQTTEVSAG